MHNDKQYQRELRRQFNDAEKILKSGDTDGYLVCISNKFRALLLNELDALLAYHYLNGFHVEIKVFAEANSPPAVRVFTRGSITDHDSLG